MLRLKAQVQEMENKVIIAEGSPESDGAGSGQSRVPRQAEQDVKEGDTEKKTTKPQQRRPKQNKNTESRQCRWNGNASVTRVAAYVTHLWVSCDSKEKAWTVVGVRRLCASNGDVTCVYVIRVQ